MNLLAFFGLMLGFAAVLHAFKLYRQNHSGPSSTGPKLLDYFRGAVAPKKSPASPSIGALDSSQVASVMGATAARSPQATNQSPAFPAPAAQDQITGEGGAEYDKDDDGSEIEEALRDATFEDYSGQHIPRVQVLSDFSQVLLDQTEVAGPPTPGESTAPTVAQADSLYTAVQASVSRLEVQMKELYDLQLQLLAQRDRLEGKPPSTGTGVGEANSSDVAAGEMGGGDDDELSFVGGGLSAQFGEDNASFLMTLEEAGGSLGEDAIFTLNVSEAEDPAWIRPAHNEPERGVEINQYFHSLLQTKQMTHDLIEAIQHKKPARVVKHWTRQIARSIEHYGQHKDANVAVAIVSMLSSLSADQVRRHDEDLAEIGRLFGMSAPLDTLDQEPVEADDDESADESSSDTHTEPEYDAHDTVPQVEFRNASAGLSLDEDEE